MCGLARHVPSGEPLPMGRNITQFVPHDSKTKLYTLLKDVNQVRRKTFCEWPHLSSVHRKVSFEVLNSNDSSASYYNKCSMLVYRHPPLTLTRAAWTMNTEAFDHAMFCRYPGSRYLGSRYQGSRLGTWVVG